jgi:cytochrome c-type biogenesis protein CcmH
MLGRAYKSLQRYPEAVEALSQAHQRQPGEAAIMIEYAEALAQANQGRFPPQARQLLDRALTVTPDDAKALTLAGGAAFEAKDYRTAVRHWERLALQVPPDSELGLALASGIGRARELARGAQPPRAAPTPEAVLGEVRLADGLKGKAAADDTVFIFARAAQGPRMPLAITRTRVKDLPARFQLDNSMAMNQQLKLSAFQSVIVTARVSRTGNAVPQSGDLQGESAPVSPGAHGVSVVIDKVLP